MASLPKSALLLAAFTVIALGVVLSLASIHPQTTGIAETHVIIDNTFNLSRDEVYRQGIGAFHGGENISLSVESPSAFQKNFSVITYSGPRFANYTDGNVAFSFTAGADYYEAVFYTQSPNAGTVHFQVLKTQIGNQYALSWLNAPGKILFLLGIAVAMLVALKPALSGDASVEKLVRLPSLGRLNSRRLLIFLIISLSVWLIMVALNPRPIASFENWYTDHARHPYVASLFLKDGLAIFNQPLGQLSSQDHSTYMFVTWPEMPHLYPLGSVFLFLPFGALLQVGLDPILVYKLEIAVFLVFAHVCLFFFFKFFLKKDMHIGFKAVGAYVIYISLVLYAADGMFDSVAFLFSLFAVTMFLTERYDMFFLSFAAAFFFKYQAGIFLFPLLIVGSIRLLQKNSVGGLARNRRVVLGVLLLVLSGFTAILSAPFLAATRPELVMNGVNAFLVNAQIPWLLQAFGVLLTLGVTLVFAFYMRGKNSLVAFSALFLLVPSFLLPYFQNWYLPFIFVYALIPQRRREAQWTIVWLVFMVIVLSYGGLSFIPTQIYGTLKNFFGIP
jgi:hypothetical protein